MIEVK